MEEEVKSLIKVCVYAIISIYYCYCLPPKIKSGVPRLLSVSPVLALFLILPMFFSSVNLSVTTTLFFTWLANFKLILFSFDKGPLIPLPPKFSLFFCFTCFPIKTQQNPKPQSHRPKLIFAIKLAAFCVLLHVCRYSQNIYPILVLGLYFMHLYLELEIVLTTVKVLLSITLECDLEPISNQPYLATSLQDFWGRRWNLMVPAILRLAVYDPMRRVSERRISPGWALFPGILASFIVSGLFHELQFFFFLRETPTWEVTMFFVLHGVCTAVEVVVKKKTTVMQRWKLSPVVSRVLTVGFVYVSGFLLFAPPLTRSGVMKRFTDEALWLIYSVKDMLVKPFDNVLNV